MRRKPRFSFLAASFTLAVALVLPACGGDDDTATPASGSDTTTTTAPASTLPGETTVPPETTAPPDTQAPVDASGIARDHIHLKYTASGQEAGEIDVAVVGSKYALEILSAAANQFALIDGSTATICAWSEPPIQCTKMDEGAETYTSAIHTSFLDPLGENGPLAGAQGVQPSADRAIAGRTAKCSKGVTDGNETEICVDSEIGILLYMKTPEGEMQLTEVSGDVPDSLFVLPEGATVSDASGQPN